MSITTNIIDAGDVLIIGAGLAGLFTALKLEGGHATVLCATKRGKGSASYWAQGGLAAALGAGDSVEAHMGDTVAAGDGLVDADIARLIAEDAGERVADLAKFGVGFDSDAAGFIFGREAAHSHDRILSVNGDGTGAAIMDALNARAEATPHIRFLEGYSAYELAIEDGRVVGVFARETGRFGAAAPLLIKARALVLASGGSGHLYEITTNPPSANGAAIALAARAGARLADLEFVQFHPTALAGLGDPAPLATEALRGRGAHLVNGEGLRFMPDYHKDAELAPRDIVARAVDAERVRTGSVGLSLKNEETGDLAENLENYFPTIAASCKRAKLDPTRALLPIAPAAHYHMGGIWVDAYGRSSLPGLWVCGEAAATGAHGANRLASNSLLEAVVFGARVAEDICSVLNVRGAHRPLPPQTHIDGDAPIADALSRLRKVMSDCVGVRRDRQGLSRALVDILRLHRAAAGLAPLTNATLAGLMITAAALKREESRGAHYRKDYPQKHAQAIRDTLTLDEAFVLANAPLPDIAEVAR